MSPTLGFLYRFAAFLIGMQCWSVAQSGQPAGKERLGPRFAFVCLASDRAPLPGALEAKLAERLKVNPAEVSKLEKIPGEKAAKLGNEVSSVKVGKIEVLIARAGFPIPKADLDYACMNSVFWPGAAQVLAKHSSHLIVTVIGEFPSPIEEGLFLTRAIAACTESYDALGVYWGSATVVHSPEFFRKYADSASTDDPPLLLWVGFLRSAGEKEGTTSFFTRGLDTFGRMEIEVVDSDRKPSEIFERVADLASYLLKNGNIVEDGHTIGSDKDEKIRVRHEDSVLDRKGKVLRIEL